MRFCRLVALVLPFVIAIWLATAPVGASAQDLIQAPEDSVFYELSNMRVEKGVVADQIAFDYKRTREG